MLTYQLQQDIEVEAHEAELLFQSAQLQGG